MSILRRQFCTFLESKRRKKWTAEFCPKQWLAAIKSRLPEKWKRRQSKLRKILRQENGDNRFEFHASVQRSISMKATASLLQKRKRAWRRALRPRPLIEVRMHGNRSRNVSIFYTDYLMREIFRMKTPNVHLRT